MPAGAASNGERVGLWLHGPVVDLMLGTGLGYLLSIPLLLALSSQLGVDDWSLAWVLILGLAISTPHYGATLLRVYERAADSTSSSPSM